MAARRGARRAGRGRGKRRRGLRRALRRIVGGLGLLAIGAVGALGGLFLYYGRGLPSVRSLRDRPMPQVSRVLDRRGRLLGEIYEERRTLVSFDRMPKRLIWCLLAAEDADFYRHEGIDYLGIVRALLRGLLRGGRIKGTSTITQQVVKQMLLSPERTVRRKVRELLLARRLERELSKDEILYYYLNYIYFGHGRYGVQEAARFYFGKDVWDLDLAEAAMIAGLPASPEGFSPRRHPEAAERRRRYVLGQLAEKRASHFPDLSAEEIERAVASPPKLAPEPTRGQRAPGIVALARRRLRALVGQEALRRGGYTIHTTIDLDLQVAAREALRRGLDRLDERHRRRPPFRAPRRRGVRRESPLSKPMRLGQVLRVRVVEADDAAGRLVLARGKRRFWVDLTDAANRRYQPAEGPPLPPSRFARPGARLWVRVVSLPDEARKEEPIVAHLAMGAEGAVILMEPRSRDLLALVGGYEDGPGFHRAVQAVRQPGSTFKPIVYAYGIHTRELTPATVVLDVPTRYDRWQPHNYEPWSHRGPVRIREALAQSINLVAVRVMERLGPQRVAEFARRLGISSELDPSLALALGASGVRPLEMVSAYATFAAGGRWRAPRLIRRIEEAQGRQVPLGGRTLLYEDTDPPRDVLSPVEAFVVTDMLRSVVTRGTARAARRLRRPVAGKTGTTNRAKDAWFVGYTPELVAGVWVGYDDGRPLGRRESGGRTALPIWVDVMERATRGRPVVDFPRPAGVVTARIDPASGKLAYEGQPDAIEEVFVEGTVPTEIAPRPDELDPDELLLGAPTGSVPAVEADGGGEGA